MPQAAPAPAASASTRHERPRGARHAQPASGGRTLAPDRVLDPRYPRDGVRGEELHAHVPALARRRLRDVQAGRADRRPVVNDLVVAGDRLEQGGRVGGAEEARAGHAEPARRVDERRVDPDEAARAREQRRASPRARARRSGSRARSRRPAPRPPRAPPRRRSRGPRRRRGRPSARRRARFAERPRTRATPRAAGGAPTRNRSSRRRSRDTRPPRARRPPAPSRCARHSARVAGRAPEQLGRRVVEVVRPARAVEEHQVREHVAPPVGALDVEADPVARAGEQREDRRELRVDLEIHDGVDPPAHEREQDPAGARDEREETRGVVDPLDPIEHAEQLGERRDRRAADQSQRALGEAAAHAEQRGQRDQETPAAHHLDEDELAARIAAVVAPEQRTGEQRERPQRDEQPGAEPAVDALLLVDRHARSRSKPISPRLNQTWSPPVRAARACAGAPARSRK